ncbi:unnamed protein product [Symbiodinium sp. CCMP2456]|nr:unnamed protein product [Symbiodinium sp. CCMP2456]
MCESDCDIDEEELLQAALQAEAAASAPGFLAEEEAAKRARLAHGLSEASSWESALELSSAVPQQQAEQAEQAQAEQAQAGALPRPSGRDSSGISAAAVDMLAARLHDLALGAGAGSISGPGMISGEPCPIVQAHARFKLNFGGVEVLFPFEQPLEPQRAVIRSVLEALALGKHAVLESPTGTGKTAAVLCACIAWQRHRMRKTGSAPQVMFATRTHAQVRQAIRELKRTPYRPIMAVLGSREAGLCIKEEVLQSAEDDGQLRHACRQARRQKTCSFHEGLASPGVPEIIQARLRGSEPWDIEDMAQFGTMTNSCPYYVAHSVAKHAQLVFCPYSYILDPSVRQASGLSCADLSGRMIILDEAHNVEGTCRDAGSAEITLDQAKSALVVIKRLLGDDVGGNSLSGDQHQILATPATKSSEELGGFMLPATVSAAVDTPRQSSNGPGPCAPVERKRKATLAATLRPVSSLLSRICDYLRDLNQPATYAPHFPEHRQVSAFLRAVRLDSEPLLRPDGASAGRASGTSVPRGEALLRELAQGGAFSAQLELAASLVHQLAAATRRPDLYVVHARPEGHGPHGLGQRPALQTWLMSAEGTFGNLVSELHGILLMSGTLSPLPATISELGPTFKSRALPALAAGHVVGRGALTVVTVSHAESAEAKLECTFHAWKRRPFLRSVGAALVTVCRAIPAGILVFLPSYDLLERCLAAWGESDGDAQKGHGRGMGRGGTKARKRSGPVERVQVVSAARGESLLDQLRQAKGTIVVEPPPSQQSTASAARVYEVARQRYETAVSQGGQAVLLAVYRGRMSEGVSFDDDFARGVVCIGIPFPNLTEERIAQKRAFNDFSVSRSTGAVSGDAWYESKALHAVAQALGRCIRHPLDFGALVLLDSRWAELGKASLLPQWLHPFMVDKVDANAAAHWLQEHFSHLSCNPAGPARFATEAEASMPSPVKREAKCEPKDEAKFEAKDEAKFEAKDEAKDEVKDEGEDETQVMADGCTHVAELNWLESPAPSKASAGDLPKTGAFKLRLGSFAKPPCLDLDSDE